MIENKKFFKKKIIKRELNTAELFYTAKVNKVVSGGKILRFVNYSIYGNKINNEFGIGVGKSTQFLNSLIKSSNAAKKNAKKYFINLINIPVIKIKFKSTILLIAPRNDKQIKTCNLISKILILLNFQKGISVKIVGSKHPVNVAKAFIKFLTFSNQIYYLYEHKQE